MINRYVICLIVFLIFSFNSFSFIVPKLTGPVVDNADMMTSSRKSQLSSFIRGINNKYNIQFQVLTVNDLQNETIEKASIDVADKWQIGTASEDKGALLLISKEERKIRIEIGQGLEGDIPDAIAKRIIMDVIRPAFKRGQYDKGITGGIVSMAKKAIPGLEISRSMQKSTSISKQLLIPRIIKYALIFIFIFFFRTGRLGFFFLGGLGSGRSRGGFSSGSSWSGGGGGFSGGGASGGW